MSQKRSIIFSLISSFLWPVTALAEPTSIEVKGELTFYNPSAAKKELLASDLDINSLTAEQLNQGYAEPVRWQQVLASLQQAGIDNRWAVLTKPSETIALEQERKQVLKDLHQLGQFWARQGKNDLLIATTTLANQLTELPLAAKQPVAMDYDLVRLELKYNPLLQGCYALTLQPRPSYIWAQGLVRLPGKRPFVGGAFVYDYGKRLSMLPGADKQQVWVIQPDGELVTSTIDAFDPEFVGVAPGATIYVGFKHLPKPFANLNQRVITLLANRGLE